MIGVASKGPESTTNASHRRLWDPLLARRMPIEDDFEVYFVLFISTAGRRKRLLVEGSPSGDFDAASRLRSPCRCSR